MVYWKLIKETVREFYYDDPWTWSASIAFYVIFSLPAIVIITMSVAGSLYNDQAVRESMMEQARQLLGPDSVATVNDILANAGGFGGLQVAEIIGIAVLIFSATTVIVTLQNSINNIWGIRPKPEKNLFKYVLHRLLSLAMVVGMGFLLLVSLLVEAFLSIFRDVLTEWLSESSYYVISGGNIVISILVVTLIFMVIFKVLPDAKIAWRDVLVGSLVTSVLFALGKFLIGFYLGNSTFSDIYGAAGSLAVMLIWVYYSAMIVLFGAEFTWVHSKLRGRMIRPDEYAVRFRKIEREGASGYGSSQE